MVIPTLDEEAALPGSSLLVNNGETVFIGGLIQDSKIKNKDAVPVLGSIPVLGVLFGRNSHALDKTEIVVLITPQIINDKVKTFKKQTKEKVEELEDTFKKDPLPDHKQLFEMLLPGEHSGR